MLCYIQKKKSLNINYRQMVDYQIKFNDIINIDFFYVLHNKKIKIKIKYLIVQQSTLTLNRKYKQDTKIIVYGINNTYYL